MDRLSAGYGEDERVNEWVDTFEEWARRLSYGFDEYGAGEDDEPKRNGPGLYVAFVSTNSIEGIADKPEANPFHEVDGPQYVPMDVEEGVPEEDLDDADITDVYEGVKEIANDMDQAMVVWMNGRIHEHNVRFLTPREEELAYEVADVDGGTRHQSAAEVSALPGVEFTLTLSEETGDITQYRDGDIEGRKISREDDIVPGYEDDD